MADLLGELQRDAQVTLVVVTHDPHIASRAGRVLDMLDGKTSAPTEPTRDVA